DHDGYGDIADCNEADPTINPGRVEIRHNGKDDDCNAATPDNWANAFVIAVDDSSWIYYARSNGDGTFSNYRALWQLGGYYSRGVVIEDFDGDGDLDFIAGRGNGATAYYHLFINDGADKFMDAGIVGDLYNANGWAMDMAAGDFNNDGRMDFVANGNYLNTGIYLNDGMGGFTKTVINLPDTYGRGMDAADFNADGNLDFVMGTCCSGVVRLYLGNGTGNFTNSLIGTVGSDLYALAAADFDNDGKADVIAGGSSDGNPYFFKGNGDGTFQAPVYVGSLDMNYYNAIDAYDFNGDGNIDIVLSDYNVYMWFYPGNGNGTFGARTQITTSNARTSLLAISAPPSGNPAGFPVADAEPQAQAIGVGDVANLNGTYSFDPDGAIVSYAWKFDDGGTGSGENVSHVYASEDLFTPALTVTDNDGKKDSASAEVFVFGNPPVADAGGPYNLGEANASNGRYTATLNGAGSSDDYGIVKYEWDMGDSFFDNFNDGVADGWGPTAGTWGISGGAYNQTNEGVDRSDTFAGDPKSGNYTIEADLMWVSGWGQEAMILFRGLDQNNHYEFILRGRGANDLLLARVQNGGWTQIGYFQLPFAPQLNTWYHLKVEAYGSSIRCYLDGALVIDVADSGLTNGKVGFSTYYTNARFDNLMVYARRTGVSAAHGFSAGTHTVTLTVTDRVGQTDTDTAQVTATAGAPPVSNPGGPYTFGEAFANQGTWTVGLNGSGSTDDVAIESYSWTFGDGGSGTGATPSHGYGAPGVYNVSLTVTDRAGQSNTVSTTVTILAGTPPVANPGGPYTVLESQVVNKHWTIAVDGTGSSDDVNIWYYVWNFGDGSAATTATANHTYANPGTYTVTLTVADHANQTHTVTTTASITGEGLPVADAGGPYLAEKGYPVTFDGSGSTDDFGILSYQWNFGDGATGSGAQPAHTYSAEGNYTATLMVRDMALQEVADTAAVNVSVGNPPMADPGGPYTTNENLPIRFNGSRSTDDYGIVSYEWAIGETMTLLQDTFDGTTLNASRWLYPSSGVTQNNMVTITGGGSSWGVRYLFSQDNFAVSGGMELQGQINQTSSGYHHLMFGFKNTGTDYSYGAMPYDLYFAAGGLQVYESGSYRGQFGTYSTNTLYDVKIVLKGISGSSPTGATYYYKPATSTTWILLYD
ncbi:MAG: PKD domain-containing protein, partial [Nitrospirota bacterium]|nr:PKD domain-containing protein [Nitrospirota bacterium]